jgi:hypothetical protein
MGTIVLLIFMGGERPLAVEFNTPARCEAARSAIKEQFSGYLQPKTVCVPR